MTQSQADAIATLVSLVIVSLLVTLWLSYLIERRLKRWVRRRYYRELKRIRAYYEEKTDEPEANRP